MSVSQDTAVVGAFKEDDAGRDSESADIFERDAGGNWGQVAKLIAADVEAFSLFGRSASIHGDTAVVGSIWDDDAGTNSASASVLERSHGRHRLRDHRRPSQRVLGWMLGDVTA